MTIYKNLKELANQFSIQDLEELSLADLSLLVEINNNLIGTGELNDEEIKEYLENWKIKRLKSIFEDYL